MTWLTDAYEIAGWYLLIVALLPAMGVAGWMGEALNLERQRTHEARRDACNETARARAAERPYRTRLRQTSAPIEPARPEITMTAPTYEDLRAWDAEVEGLPWGYAMNQRLADIIDDPLSCTPKVSPRAPVTTARLRRMVAA